MNVKILLNIVFFDIWLNAKNFKDLLSDMAAEIPKPCWMKIFSHTQLNFTQSWIIDFSDSFVVTLKYLN